MKFSSVSIILPTLTETDSFIKLIKLILKTNELSDIEEFIVVICKKTTKESLKSIQIGKQIAQKSGISFSVIHQKRPYFGGAIQEGFQSARGSHVCMVTPDLDTAPDKIPDMIALAKQYPNDIISGSRWLPGGGFRRYNKLKQIWNWFSQLFLRSFYLSSLTDFTWGNHMGPTILYQSINFRELKHPINIEKVVIPLRLNITFHEIAAICRMPENDQSVNSFFANLEYLRPAIFWRFASKNIMLKNDVDYHKLYEALKG